MSLHLLPIVCATSFPCSSLSTFRRIASFQHHGNHRCSSPRIRCSGQPLLRRSANYQPNLWTNDYIQSLTSDHSMDEQNAARISNLEKEVVKLIHEEKELEDQLHLIDHLQQLGVAYHFKDDIKDALGSIHGSLEDTSKLLKDNLDATALLFRLLRENGFDVSEDMFSRFKDEKGHLKTCLQHQTKGMLSLYEASYLGKEGEFVLIEAMDFTTKHLKKLMEERSLEPRFREHVAHALELPLNWRMERIHTRWFIETYQREATMNPLLLELARLDFNLIQSMHKRELKEVSRWWTDLGLAQRLPFSRDRLMENYLWTVG
ncbi:monoterpene synthase 7, chloroplastic-like [Musa acuminata AAA Group]|uniref:monoterpene synthase 7, chloroplastic-like n=1 Tax=Musa acuminata AAA Group TaxID=214697 RepID=UPI0031D8D89F